MCGGIFWGVKWGARPESGMLVGGVERGPGGLACVVEGLCEEFYYVFGNVVGGRTF